MRTRQGLVAGRSTATPGVTAWLGISYAGLPVGPRRWRPPQPPPSWSGIRPATQFSASPWQMPADAHSAYLGTEGPFSEDCLTLNVWASGSTGGAEGR